MSHVLLLNADYTPLHTLPWQRAVVLVLDDKVALVSAYAGRVIRSASQVVPLPAVVALRRYSRFRGRARLTRRNVLARDGFACQYCGVAPRRPEGGPDIAQLTLDHVVPKAQAVGGRVRLPDGRWRSVTCWENVITACQRCNGEKADRTPAQAGMVLRRRPRVPSPLEVLRTVLGCAELPEEWEGYLS